MKVPVPFIGPFYEARSSNVDAQRAVNCYLELDQANPRAPVALYGTPGTVLELTLPTSPVREGVEEGGYTWWVSGSSVYKVDSSYGYTLLGTIGSSTGRVSMASNGVQILIVDGVGGWLIDVVASTLTQITDPDFPNGVKRADFQDGYYLVTGNGSQSFFINEAPYEGGNWDALDFASAEGSPDNTVGIICDHLEVWLFGSRTAEPWTSTTSADLPFARSGNSFIEHGCASAATICKADNTVFWLGADDKGSGMVWRADGYTPVRISTHALEKKFAGYTLSDAFGFTYQQEGHIFYVLTFPTDSKTWAFDASTLQWHERVWTDPTNGSDSRWRANCHVFANSQHLVGDYESGNIYSLDLDTYTDNGGMIRRLRRTTTTQKLQERMFYASLQVDMETGVGLATGQGSAPLLMMRYSDDGGHTWTPERTVSIGAIGEYNARAKFNRLGSGRNRLWEISMTDPVKFAVIGAVAEAEAGV